MKTKHQIQLTLAIFLVFELVIICIGLMWGGR